MIGRVQNSAFLQPWGETKYIFWKIVWSQANIRNTFSDQSSPRQSACCWGNALVLIYGIFSPLLLPVKYVLYYVIGTVSKRCDRATARSGKLFGVCARFWAAFTWNALLCWNILNNFGLIVLVAQVLQNLAIKIQAYSSWIFDRLPHIICCNLPASPPPKFQDQQFWLRKKNHFYNVWLLERN